MPDTMTPQYPFPAIIRMLGGASALLFACGCLEGNYMRDADDPKSVPTLFEMGGKAADSSSASAEMLTRSATPQIFVAYMDLPESDRKNGPPYAPALTNRRFSTILAKTETSIPFRYKVTLTAPPDPASWIERGQKPVLRTAFLGIRNEPLPTGSHSGIGGMGFHSTYGRFDSTSFPGDTDFVETPVVAAYRGMWEASKSIAGCDSLAGAAGTGCAQGKYADIKRYAALLASLDPGDPDFYYPEKISTDTNLGGRGEWTMGITTDFLLLYVPDGEALALARSLYDPDGACNNLALGYNLRRLAPIGPAFDTTLVKFRGETLGRVILEKPHREYKVTCAIPESLDIPLTDRFHVQHPPVVEDAP